MELYTARLQLREFGDADWPNVHEYNSDPEVMQYLPSDPGTEEQSRELVRWCITQSQTDPRVYYDLAVVHTAESKVIGWCSFAWRYDEVDQAEIAYILNRQYWGHGFATEIAARLLQLGFDELGAHRIFATCRPANVASRRVLEKIGMQREGHLRQHRRMKGGWHDSFLYAILDHEWKQGIRTPS
jgi:RimJ/RimL family protein N-acetyltransferase